MSAVTRRGALLSAMGALGACASMRDPAPGVLRIGGAYEVTLTREWSDFTPDNARNMRLLSLNGPALDRLYLAALKKDERLVRKVTAGERVTTLPHDDAIDFIARSVDGLGYEAPQIEAMATYAFGVADGWRMTLQTETGDGLLISGQARMAAHAGRLCVALHLAAREHYHEATRADAEALMASIVLR